MNKKDRDSKGKRVSTYEIYDLDDSYSDAILPRAATFFSATTKRNKPEQKSFAANNAESGDRLPDEMLLRAAEKNLQLMQGNADRAAENAKISNVAYESTIKLVIDKTGDALDEIEKQININILRDQPLMKQMQSYKGGAASQVKAAMSALNDIRHEDFEEIDFKKISALINTLQQLAFKLKHETVTKAKFYQKAEQAKAQQLFDALSPVVAELAARQKLINGYKEKISGFRKIFLDPFEKAAESAEQNLKIAKSEFLRLYHEHRQSGGTLKLESPAALDLVHKTKPLPQVPEKPKFTP